jgi:hypothetical protein
MRFHSSCRIQWRISQEIMLIWVGITLAGRGAAVFFAFVLPSSAETDSFENHRSITIMLTEVNSHTPNEWVRCGGIAVESSSALTMLDLMTDFSCNALELTRGLGSMTRPCKTRKCCSQPLAFVVAECVCKCGHLRPKRSHIRWHI